MKANHNLSGLKLLHKFFNLPFLFFRQTINRCRKPVFDEQPSDGIGRKTTGARTRLNMLFEHFVRNIEGIGDLKTNNFSPAKYTFVFKFS